jgi:Cu+-exporting ATPase
MAIIKQGSEVQPRGQFDISKPSEHPLAKAILKKAFETSLPVIEPSSFSYLPGKGLVCSVHGEEIVVGNKTLLAEKHIDVNEFGKNSDHSSEILIARGGHFLGAVQVADRLRPETIAATSHACSFPWSQP